MSIDVNDEILQDFLVEAGEILEQLSEQLVDLEQQPEDFDLLNAVFRGFHTIKGGAGFLSINSLVEICHRAEDVFNVLRQGQRSVSPDLMDAILQVLDVVNSMFDLIRDGTEPDPADPQLMQRLNGFTAPQSEAPPVSDSQEAKQAEPVRNTSAGNRKPAAENKHTDLSDTEFEELLDAIQKPENNPSPGDEISEDEFEALLDDLHGKGRFNAGIAQPISSEEDHTGSDEINEDEFENLLDQIHGKGQFDPSKVTIAEHNEQADQSTGEVSDDEGISEEEFENLLDEIHDKGQFKGQVDNLSIAAFRRWKIRTKKSIKKQQGRYCIKSQTRVQAGQINTRTKNTIEIQACRRNHCTC